MLIATTNHPVFNPTQRKTRINIAFKNHVSITEAESGAIEVLVNNAALDSAMLFHKERPEVIKQIISTDLTSSMLLGRSLLPGLLTYEYRKQPA